MKTLNNYINEWKYKKGNDIKILVKGEYHLRELIVERLKENIENPYLLDLDVSNCTRMDDLFSNGIRDYLREHNIYSNEIKRLDLSTWNTENVESMYGMFFGCERLETIVGIENFNMKKCKNISYMFQYCHSLKLNVDNWKVNKGIQKSGAFDANNLTDPIWFYNV